MQVLIRLTKYYELNVVRILFRFMSTIPLLILAIDALVGETLNAKRVFGPYTWTPVANNLISIASSEFDAILTV